MRAGGWYSRCDLNWKVGTEEWRSRRSRAAI